MLLVVILGFVVDGTRLMVIHGELQNATDACALAAAAELNGQAGATFRAAAAGSQVGGALNKKNFQNLSVAIEPIDVKFKITLDGSYVNASGSAVNYRFAQCTARYNGWINLFMGLVGSGTDEPVASSVSGQQPTRKICTLPLALQTLTTSGDLKNFLRFTDHENSPPSKTDNEYTDLINRFGSCNIPANLSTIQVRTPQNIENVFRQRYETDPNFPDQPGYSSRRLMAVPVINASGVFSHWACLELVKNSNSFNVNYVGPATYPSSRCVVSGITGHGAGGPPAPVLLR